MKALRYLMMCMTCVLLYACQDLSSLYEELEQLDGRADAAEIQIQRIREEAERLGAVIAAIGKGDYVTDVQMQYDQVTLELISYTLYFSESSPVTVHVVGKDGEDGDDGIDGADGKDGPDGADGADGQNGQDGQDGRDGKDGTDGTDGQDGKDGRKPLISVGLHDGEYYWMADGRWILDGEGNMLPVHYEEPVRFRLEDGIWYASFNSGDSWIEMDPFVYSFSGITDVRVDEDAVSFVLADGNVLVVPYRNTVSFTLSREGTLDAVQGATYTLTYRISGARDAAVTLRANDAMGAASVTAPDADGSGTITYTISGQNDVSRQRLLVILNHSGGTVTKQLTFKESGRLDVEPVEPLPASGGECLIQTVLEGYRYCDCTVTAGGDWLRFVSTSSYGSIYEAGPNPSAVSRVAEVTFTVKSQYFTPLFTKKLRIVQFGTGDFPSYQEYVGNWTMSGMDAMSGELFESDVRIIENPEFPDAYVVYGLPSAAGTDVPVHAVYDSVTGDMRIDAPQQLADGMVLNPVIMENGSPRVSEELHSFRFRVSRNVMTADMDNQTSFMFFSEDHDSDPGTGIFCCDVVLNREGVAEYYSDGEVVMLNEADNGYTPLNIVIFGDGYQTKDLRHGGKFERSARGAVSSFFGVEPYASFKDRFDIYMVPFASVDEGPDVTSSGIVRDTYFSSVCAGGGNTLVTCNYESVLAEVRKLGIVEDDFSLYRTIVILLVNTTEQSGSCWYIKAGRTDTSNIGDGIMSMAIAMLAADTMGSGGLVRHEAGGHAFGRLADEYNWGGTADAAKIASLRDQQDNYGFYLNVTADVGGASPWAHFIGLEGYEDVGYHEGAWGCSTGLYRPTQTSMMLNNQGKFNAPSRELIYKRIVLQSEGPGSYSFDDFLNYDRKNL